MAVGERGKSSQRVDIQDDRSSVADTAKPVRLRPALYQAAAHYADIEHRSIAKQVEYWAEIGRWMATSVDQNSIYALLAGTASLDVNHQQSINVSTDDMLRDLAEAKKSGSIKDRILGADVIYDAAPNNPQLIRRTEAQGSVSFGSFVDGRFVEDESKSAPA